MRGSQSLLTGPDVPVVTGGAPYLICSHSDDCRNKLKKLKTCCNQKALRRCTSKMNALKSIVVLLLLITAQPSYSRPTVAPQREKREGSGIELPQPEEVDNNSVLPPVQRNRGTCRHAQCKTVKPANISTHTHTHTFILFKNNYARYSVVACMQAHITGSLQCMQSAADIMNSVKSYMIIIQFAYSPTTNR